MKNSILYKSFMAGLFITCANNALAAPLNIAGPVTESANATYDSIDFAGDFVLTIDTAAVIDVTTDVTVAADDEGSIDVTAGSSLTVNGDIGTSSTYLKSLTTDTTAAVVVDKVAGDAYIKELDINTSGAGASFTSTGGTLNVADGTVGTTDLTIAGTVSLTDTNVVLEDAASIDATSAITLAGTTAVDKGFKVENTIAGSTLTISDTVNTGAIELGNTADLSIVATGSSIVGSVLLGTGSTLNVDSAMDTVTLGAITTSTASEGTVNFTKDFTLDNTIGTSLLKIDQVDVTGAGIALTAGADIYADAVNFAGTSIFNVVNNAVNAKITTNVNGEGTLNFIGTGAVTDTIGASGLALAAVNYTGATTTLGTSIHAGAVTLGTASNVSATTDSTITSNLTVDSSTLNLSSHDVTVSGTAAFANTSTLATTINSTTDYGALATGGATTINANTVVNINVADKSAVKSGDIFTFVNGSGGTGVATVTTTTDNSNLFNFVQGASTEDLAYTAQVAVAFDTDTANTALANFGTVLQNDVVNGNFTTGLASAVDNLAGLTATQQKDVMASMVPELNGAQIESSFANQTRIFDFISRRIRSDKNSLWAEVSYANNDKDKDGAIDGYDADSTSITVGIDTNRGVASAVGEIGVAFTYTETDIEGEGSVAGNENDVDSYNVTLYGAKQLASGAKIDAQATLGTADFDSSRNLSVIGSDIARGDYDATTYGFNVDVSKDYDVKGTTVIPVVGLAYNYADFDSYTETGSASALTVDSETFDSLKSKVGAEVTFNKVVLGQDWTMRPEIRGYWKHEFIDDGYDYTAKLVGGSAKFTTNGSEPESDSFSFGAGLDLVNKTGWNVGVAYDADLSNDSTNQIAWLSLSKKF
ncbi:MAG: autotransporter domain-containing protein [Proteobacteria bacterium]|nr:autotransporter domain-containing protein [Pseudomonadota bacterium]